MIGEPMPAMPSHYRVTQIAYAKMISEVHDIIIGTNLKPQEALILAFIGDQTVTPSELQHYGYFIGTNPNHNLRRLEGKHLIMRLKGPANADQRRRPIKLTPAGRHLAILLRQKLAKKRPFEILAIEAAA